MKGCDAVGDFCQLGQCFEYPLHEPSSVYKLALFILESALSEQLKEENLGIIGFNGR